MSLDFITSMRLPPAEELLMRAARTSLDKRQQEQLVAVCRQQIDWSSVITTANQHGVASLLHRSLSTLAPDVVPPHAMRRLAAGLAMTTAVNLRLTGQLIEILERLTAEGIPALPYKGPVLATLAYGNLALRQFADIDMFVPAGSVWQVDAVLVKGGYTRDGEPGGGGGVLPSEGQFLYEHRTHGTIIEIHWELAQRFYGFPFSFEQLWQRRMSLTVGGHDLSTFGFDDTVLTLALHHTKHRWERLIWIADLAELLGSRPDESWLEIIEKGRRIGAGRAVLLGLHLAQVVCGAVLPDGVRQQIDSDREIDLLARQVIDGLVGGGGRFSAIGERTAFNVQARERLGDRLRFVWRRALVPTLSDRSAIRLPAVADPLYYLVRPIRLLLERLKSIMRSRT